MAQQSLFEHVTNTLVALNTSIRNMRLYPPASAVIVRSLARTHDCLTAVFTHTKALNLAESEKQLLINGSAVSAKALQKPHFKGFVRLLLDFKIHSVSFYQGVDTIELGRFVDMISHTPEEIAAAGGLQKQVAEKNLSHIRVNDKVFVVQSAKGKRIAGASPDAGEILARLKQSDPQTLKALAGNVEWVMDAFGAGLAGLARADAGRQPATFAVIVRTLDRLIADARKKTLGREMAGAVMAADAALWGKILLQDAPGVLGAELLTQVLARLDSQQVRDVSRHLKTMAGDVERAALKRAYERLVDARSRRSAPPATAVRKMTAPVNIKEGIDALLKGRRNAGRDPGLTAALPGAIDKLFAKGSLNLAAALIARLAANLSAEDDTVRRHAAAALAGVCAVLMKRGQLQTLRGLCGALFDWLGSQEQFSEEYGALLDQLRRLAVHLIRRQRFADCRAVLAGLAKELRTDRAAGNVFADAQITSRVRAALAGLAEGESLAWLLGGLEAPRPRMRDDAADCMAALGAAAVGPVLQTLAKTQKRSLRVKLIQVVTAIGPAAAAQLKARIAQGGEWFYLRNLILLLGKTGAAGDQALLIPFLTHEDLRLQREALNSIFNLGGEKREHLLLGLLDTAGDDLKVHVIGMLGALRSTAAIAPLTALLQSKNFASAALREEIHLQSCRALGAIGDLDTLPLLESLAAPRRFLGITRTDPKLSKAAGEAIRRIRRFKPAG